jgi:MSHA biogenesis protein MshO
MAAQRNQRGATLIELIMVIAILGVIAAVASVFIKGPIDAYVDSARRAALTDASDTAIRRMARDIRKALPNSTRIPSTDCLEFIPTKTAGRYRAAVDVLSTGDILNFVASDTSFNMLSLNSDLPADQKIEIGDVVAVYNLGVSGADAYAGDNTSTVRSLANDSGRKESTISVDAKLFPFASGSKRFYVIPAGEQVVGYVCNGNGTDAHGTGTGTLRRYIATLPGANSCTLPVIDQNNVTSVSIMASNVASCNFVHNVSDLQRNDPVQLTITFTDSGESISLYHQVYENNWP